MRYFRAGKDLLVSTRRNNTKLDLISIKRQRLVNNVLLPFFVNNYVLLNEFFLIFWEIAGNVLFANYIVHIIKRAQRIKAGIAKLFG